MTTTVTTAANTLNKSAPSLHKAITKLRVNDAHFASLYAEYQQLEQELDSAPAGADTSANQTRHAELIRKLTLMAQAEKENSCCGGCGCGGN